MVINGSSHCEMDELSNLGGVKEVGGTTRGKAGTLYLLRE